MVNVLFVCMGNICRSPAAEAVMNSLLQEHQLVKDIQCDSAGIADYHVGSQADKRMILVGKERGFQITSIARQISYRDLEEFDYIIAMDEYNYFDIKALDRKTAFTHKIYQLKEFCSNSAITGVPDPYYGGQDGFHRVIDILEDGCSGLLSRIKSDRGL